MPIIVTDRISTTSPSDTYATHSADLGKGGFRSVSTLADMNAISSERKEVGMWVKVSEDNGVYEWNGTTFVPVYNTGAPADVDYFEIPIPTNSSISGWKIIKVDDAGFAKYASSDTVADATKVLGVSTHAVTDNTPVTVRTEGTMEDSGWSFTPGPIFVGLNGNITQTVPTSGFILQLGQALSATKIYINIRTPISLT